MRHLVPPVQEDLWRVGGQVRHGDVTVGVKHEWNVITAASIAFFTLLLPVFF